MGLLFNIFMNLNMRIARRGIYFNCLIFYESKHEDSKERY
jgi:hypothetical protein